MKVMGDFLTGWMFRLGLLNIELVLYNTGEL